MMFASEPEKKPKPKTSDPDIDVDVKEKPAEKDTKDSDHPWKLFLFNDDEHTFQEVINQLIKALGCGHSKDEKIATKAHQKGKALVYKGTFEECFEINTVLKEIQLVTEIKG